MSTLSDDGKWMWNGSEWIPAPPTSETDTNPSGASIQQPQNINQPPQTRQDSQAQDINKVMNIMLENFPNNSCDVVNQNCLVMDSSILSRSEVNFVFGEEKTSFKAKTNYFSIRGTRWIPFILWVIFFWFVIITIPILIWSVMKDAKTVKEISQVLTSEGFHQLS